MSGGSVEAAASPPPEHPIAAPATHPPVQKTDQMPASKIKPAFARAGRAAATNSGVEPFLTRPYWDPHWVTSVFDHCNPNYTHDGKICEFDGTVALKSYGVDPSFSAGYATSPGGSNYLYYDGHNGWDLALNYEPVLAAAPGTVFFSGWDSSGFGNTILIDHGNGFATRYAHLSQLWVNNGDVVTRGEQIGVSGNTGASTGPHLHFGLYVMSSWEAIDPWGWSGSFADPWPYDSGDYWISGNPINPVPSAPQNVTAVPATQSATVSWSPPAFLADAVTGYTVTASPGGTFATVGAGQTSAVISGLDSSTAYTFTVAASSAVGTGAASAPSNAVAPHSGALDWSSLGGGLASSPAVATVGGREDAFVQGTDGQLWHRWWTGSAWTAWEALGGVLRSAPAAVWDKSGHLDVFVRGTDDAMWHKRWDGTSWSPWSSLGGVLKDAPAGAWTGPDSLEVFVHGADDAVWYGRWTGSSFSWLGSLGGVAASAPAAVSWGPDRVDVFVRGVDNGMWHRWGYQGTWADWESLGGTLTGAATAASWQNGRLDVFAIGLGQRVWYRVFQGEWTGWQSISGLSTGAPAAVGPQAGYSAVFVRGTDAGLWTAWANL